MFYRYIAAILLLPASCVVFRSPRLWWYALRQGMYYFFSTVVKTAPGLLERGPSRLHNLCLYYPMRVGIDLVRTRSVRATARHMGRILKKKLLGAAHTRTPWHPGPATQPPLAPLGMERLRAMLSNPTLRVVSFDIFDTLLLRPAIQPRDIFYLIARKVDEVHGIAFVKLRGDAEERLGNPHATLQDIYAFMQRTYGLSAETTAALMAEELRCEETLLTPRQGMAELHAEALSLGKRVIALSDMYLPGDVLHGILRRKGLDVAAVYVSCDHGARKSDGALYDVVLAAEGVQPSEMLHIGDNYVADYVRALEKNIVAVHVPSVVEMAFAGDAAREALFMEGARQDPLWSLLLGFGLNELYSGPQPPDDVLCARDLRHFSLLTVAPLITGFCLSIANNADIQNKYPRIHFASRDGYLPHRVYEVIRRHVPCLQGVYFYAGRRAYYSALYGSFWEYAASLRTAANAETYTLWAFAKAYFQGDAVLTRLEEELTEEEKDLPFFLNKRHCLDILQRFRDDIDANMDKKRQGIAAYYRAVFDGAEARHLVFDLGYSGSIGRALTAITGRPVDKLYFWENPENKGADKTMGTCTRVFMKKRGYAWSDILHEELFSPCEGGVIGFDGTRPVLEEATFSPMHQRDLALVQKTCVDFAEAFCALLGGYTSCMTVCEPDAAVEIGRVLLEDTAVVNMRLFKNIIFPDPVYHTVPLSLEKKMERYLAYRTVFAGTGFDNPANALRLTPRLEPDQGRLGIHLHLYHTVQSQEVLRYLQNFPAPFDLYITITNPAFARTAQHLFSPATLPHVHAVTVLPVPNRGRDIAPWVLGMRPWQGEYDLFCHIHTKKSEHMGFGDAWRRYFFDNLLRPDAVNRILGVFKDKPNVGCLFPAIHAGVREVMNRVDVPLYGSEYEYALICDILSRMGLHGELRKSEWFFSVGSMLWYRPDALRQLFTFPLSLEEFASEPIGIGGTLAHALERLPALLAERNGYRARTFTPYAAV